VASRPRVLLADEPTGNLDQATSAEIMGLFEELHTGGLTLVVITHDADVARRASRRSPWAPSGPRATPARTRPGRWP